MLNKELEYSVNHAFHEARAKGHEYLTLEHLLLAIMEHVEVIEILEACGASVDLLTRELEGFVEDNTPLVSERPDDEVQTTLSFQRVLQRAIMHVQASEKAEVTPANVLVAVYSEKESFAAYLLQKYNVDRLDVVQYLSHGISRMDDAIPSEHQQENEEEPERNAKQDPLSAYTDNLNEQALDGRIDPLIGRGLEVERCVQILCRRRKNNPLLVGEAGVGKTAIAEGLARLIVEEKVPEVLQDAVIYALDLGALLAGTKYRGDFEKRLKAVMNALKEQDKAVLFIDEIHTIIGAGAASGGVMDASNLLKPALANGDVKCIGATTYQEYRGVFEKDRALARRFQKIDVNEPSVDDTYAILRGLKTRFEEHHGVRYTNKALQAAAELADRYINDRQLPDKAIDVIDEVGAGLRLRPASKRKKTVSVGDVEAIIAKIARVPPKSVSRSDREVLRSLDRDLKLVIFGQDEAIHTLSSAIKLARSGLGDENKPIGSFLLAGPTGVGKTEVSKQLAKFLGIDLLRFDMSEYMERHTVSRLIGAPPGYVGYDQGGLLTDAVLKNPHAVILLDEIEKAHPEVFNLLLQVMDHGTLTDNNGRKADFRNVIFLMTTNCGAEDVSRRSIGFTEQDHSTDMLEAIRKTFTPEFRNRLDAIVQFEPLDKQTILSVVDKFLVQLEMQLQEKNVELVVKKSTRLWLAEHGFDSRMGARPMTRLIQDRIKRPLADALLFGDLRNGGEVTVGTKQSELTIRIKGASQSDDAEESLVTELD